MTTDEYRKHVAALVLQTLAITPSSTLNEEQQDTICASKARLAVRYADALVKAFAE